ncbi:MAG: DMT family transporter [Tabrizicola sp.]|nr:DMT family transporter [Tabrizicola sp.]
MNLTDGKIAATQRGIVLMLGAVFCFTAMDAVAKGLLISYPAPIVIWARFMVMLVLVLAVLRHRSVGLLRTRYPWLHFWRGLFQFATVYLFFLSLRHIGLAEAQALADVSPVLITLGAAVFLGEKLGPHRIAAILTAMIGAMIVIRPGFGVFTMAALLPLGAAFTYSAAALITRKVGAAESPWTAMLYASLYGVAFSSLPLLFVLQPVPFADLWRFLLLGALGTCAQLLIIRSFSVAEASVVAPFTYAGLVTATFWGILLFGEYPDVWTVIGGLVIVLAGLYVWHRETRAIRRG